MNESPRPRRRWLWISGGIVLLLVVGLVIAVPLLLDVERYRGRIERALTEATGWDAEIGSIRLSVLSGMALEVSPARIVAPGGDTSGLEIDALEVHAELMPLLRGELRVQSIALKRPRIKLVRPSEQQGWVLPSFTGKGQPSEPAAAPAGKGLQVAIERVDVRDGSLVIDDRVKGSPLRMELAQVDVSVAPTAGTVSGSAHLLPAGAQLEWAGTLEQGLTVNFDGLRTERLHPWVGPELVHPGGMLEGEVRLNFPFAVEGRLKGSGVTLLAGERPFGKLTAALRVAPNGDHWDLESLELIGDGLKVTGSGPLFPAVDLVFTLPSTPIDTALESGKAVLPLPLDLRAPGDVHANVWVEMPEGGALGYAASGSLSAAEFHLGTPLPPARGVRADFELGWDGALEIRIVEGSVGGGPVTGTARMASIAPPDKLVLSGGIQNAVLGQLLGGMVAAAADSVTGPTGIDAEIGIDLSRPQLDARALSGRVKLQSQEVSMPGWHLESAIRRSIEDKLGSLGNVQALLDRKLGDRPGDEDSLSRLLHHVEASIDFDRWPWNLDRIQLDAGGLKAAGAGTFDPIAGSVDLRFTSQLDPQQTAKLVQRYGQLEVLVDREGRLTLPLQLGGSLLSPSISVDLNALATNQLGGKSPEDAVKGLVRGLIDDKLKKD